jgi:hypothetical protein
MRPDGYIEPDRTLSACISQALRMAHRRSRKRPRVFVSHWSDAHLHSVRWKMASENLLFDTTLVLAARPV